MPQPIVLASASARRRWLLDSAGIAYTVEPSDIEETVEAGELPLAFASRMAKEKALDVAQRQRDVAQTRWILGADTIVVLGDRILGKPKDRADARRMLALMSDTTHQVITAFCLLGVSADDEGGVPKLRTDATIEKSCITRVTFRKLMEMEVERYLDQAAWADKAGGYAVQEHAAGMVRAIEGSYTNVVGLPLAETIECLRAAGAVPPVPER